MHATHFRGWFRCRANLEHISQSRPESGLGLSHFQYESLENHLRCSLDVLAPQRTANLVCGGWVEGLGIKVGDLGFGVGVRI